MAKTKRLIRSIYRLLLPIVILAVLAIFGAGVWLIHTIAHPVQNAYLVTPEKYGRFSTRGAQITDETWTNRDGTSARGWLLRGSTNAPAVILLHRYGADRSHVLDLGIKLNEATNYTILMPDLRGHGREPTVKSTTFGGCETEDALSAIDFLQGLKTVDNIKLVGESFGFYGVEMGAFSALSAAAKEPNIKALALDSPVITSDDILGIAMEKQFPFGSPVSAKIASIGAYPYFYNGCYDRSSLCETAKLVANRDVLLLAGSDSESFKSAANKLKSCFGSETIVDSKTDLNPSGYNLTIASLEQASAYDQRVIGFFSRVLGANFGVETKPMSEVEKVNE